MKSKTTKQVTAHEVLVKVNNAMRVIWDRADDLYESSVEHLPGCEHWCDCDSSLSSEVTDAKKTREAVDTVSTVIEKVLDDYGDYLKEFEYERQEDDIRRSPIEQAARDLDEVVAEFIAVMEYLEHKIERGLDPTKCDEVRTLRDIIGRFENIDISVIKEVHA